MADPFVAEIRIFGFNFPPKTWAFCDGQLIPISQNTALFALLGTFYGGDGKSTFALPNLQGSAAMHQGQGPGLSQRFLGEQSGSAFVTLIESEMPSHNHPVVGSNANATLAAPAGSVPAKLRYSTGTQSGGGVSYSPTTPANAVMAPEALAPNGGSQPHNNMQPYLVLNFCIALQGVFPARH